MKRIFLGIIFTCLLLYSENVAASFFADQDMDGSDLVNFITAYGTNFESPSYTIDADFGGDDDDVDDVDLRTFISYFGCNGCDGPEAIAEIGISGGIVEIAEEGNELDGAQVDVPPDALTTQTNITISADPDPVVMAQVPDVEESFADVELGPSGIHFEKSVTVNLISRYKQ